MSDAPSKIPWPPLLLVSSVLVAVGVHLAWPVPLWAGRPVWVGGVLLIAMALLLTLWAGRTMRAAQTTTRPNRPATALVTTGPFAYSRNPLYLALVLIGTGVPLLLNDALALIGPAMLWLALHLYVVPREEEHLAGRFPEAFAQYRLRVRRWI